MDENAVVKLDQNKIKTSAEAQAKIASQSSQKAETKT